MGAAGAAYEGGLLAVIADPFGAALCLFVAGMFYVRILRRMELLTIADFFRGRYGPRAELLASLSIIPCYVGWTGAQFVAFGYILHTLTGIDTTLAIGIGAAIVVTYTMAGGMWAVAITDFVQAMILIAGLTFLLPIVLQAAGGWSSIESQVGAEYFRFLPETSFKDWIWYIEAWIVIGLGSIPTQDMFQRALGAKSEKVAQNSAYLSGLLYLTVGMIPVALGIAGAVVIKEISDPELILPTLGLKYMHPLGMALFVGALISALMSSADSALLATASVFGQNLVKRFKKDTSERYVLRVIRWTVLGTALLSLAIALYFQNVYELMVNSWAVLLVSLFAPLTAGLYWKKANGPAAVTSIIVGFAAWILFAYVQSEYPADLLATALAALSLVVVTLATSKRVPAISRANPCPIEIA
jgi:SSS family transporter